MKIKRVIILSVLFSIITSCNLWAGKEQHNYNETKDENLITVEITGARTISAGIPTISSYELYGAFSGEGKILLGSFNSLAGASVTIQKGLWDFTLKAKSGSNYVLEGDLDSVELLDSADPLVFSLEPLESGVGQLSVTINVPGTVNISSVVTTFNGVVQTPAVSVNNDIISFTKVNIDKGNYIFSIQMLDSSGEPLCTVSELVQILPNLISSKEITLVESDFNSAPTAPDNFDITIIDNVNDTTYAGLEFTWTDNSINETGFEIYESDGITYIGEVGAAITTFQYFGADRGLSKSYIIRGKNSFGNSAWSSTVTVTTPVVIKFEDTLRSNHIYQECIPGELIIPPTDPVDSDFLFSGWFTQTNGFGTELDNTLGPDYNMIYYSYWTKPTFYVTFNSNGADGNETMGLCSAQYGNTYTLTSNQFTNTDFSFAGWSTTALGDVEYTDNQQLTMGSSGYELFAVWKHKVIYDGNSNTAGATEDPQFYINGDTATILELDTLVRDGYIFTGWNSAADGSGTSYSAGDQVSFSDSNIILYAQWISESTFITRWRAETDNYSITIPIETSGTYNFTIDWGDGNTDTVTSFYDSHSHTYEKAGDYTILISGEINGWSFDGNTNAKKIIEIVNWGSLILGPYDSHFSGCENLKITATDAPDLSQTTSLYEMFYRCKVLDEIPGIENWDVSGITDMSNMFMMCYLFDGDLSSWDTGSVTDMSYMFYSCYEFTSDISNWNTSNVTDMSRMFYYCYVFTSDLSRWDTSSVTNMTYMFKSCDTFTSDLSSWNTSSVTDMSYMFDGCDVFTSDLSNWDTSLVTTLYRTFAYARQFNSELSNWDVSNVTTLYKTFDFAESFNPTTLNWDISSVTSLFDLFRGAKLFNADISNWNTSNVTNMGGTFDRAESFSGDISGWDTSKVTSMWNMFYGAKLFSADISGWNTSNVTDMYRMFNNCDSFNIDISGWDTSKVRNFAGMFYGMDMSNIDLSIWDTSSATSMEGMFRYATNITTDFTNWNTSNVTDMSNMFRGSDYNSSSIANFDTSSVTNMKYMFEYAELFNQDISSWNTSKVTSMDSMFREATAFNNNVSSWDTSSVTSMYYMFYEADSFDQDISSWDYSQVTNLKYFLSNTPFSSDNYNKLLVSLAAQSLQPDVQFYSGGATYTTDEAEAARQYIIDTYGWNIYDWGRE